MPRGSSQYIFSKADEFGAREAKVERNLHFLGSLLPNYAGLDNMKDDFARMLYASSSKLSNSTSGKKFNSQIAQLNGQSKEQLNLAILDIVTNK